MQKEEMFADIICPLTGEQLFVGNDGLMTKDQKKRYPVEQGIPNLSVYPFEKDLEREEKLKTVIDLMDKKGWKDALRTEFQEEYSDYVMSEERQKFLELIDFKKNDVVLEIGSGFGQHTKAIARKVKKVHSLDVDFEQVQFAKKHMQQEGIENVLNVCGGDNCLLPYAEGSCDVVILNLVLEWCGRRNSESMAESQRILLEEIYRVLKPGGQLFLATKNRFAFNYLTGCPDEHFYNMRFGSSLPGFIKSAILKIKGLKKPSGYLYSYRHLKKIVKSIGFKEPSSFLPFPDVRYPKYYIPSDGNSIKNALKNPKVLSTLFKRDKIAVKVLPLSSIKHIARGLVFILKK